MIEGANAQAHIGRQGLCQQGQPDALRSRYLDQIMCEKPPVIGPCGFGKKRGGRLIFKRRLRGLSNAWA